MCVEPTTALIIAGTAMQAVSSISQGIQQSETASYNADVARSQAAWSDYNAQAAEARAGEDARQLREQRYRALGTQRANLARSGVAASGSPLDVFNDTILSTEADAARVIYGGDAEALNLRNQGQAYRSRASFMDGQSSSALLGGIIGAGTALISGGSSYLRATKGFTGSARYYGGGLPAGSDGIY